MRTARRVSSRVRDVKVAPATHAALTALAAFAALALLALLTGCGGDDGGGAPQPDPRLLWTFQASAPVYYGSPALSPMGETVYFGTSCARFGAWETDHAFYAVYVHDGVVRWTFSLGSQEVRSSPAVGPNESISFLTQERDPTGATVLRDWLYNVMPDGQLNWKRVVNPAPRGMDVGLSAPAVGPDGSVYVAGDSLYAWTSYGDLRWKKLGTGVEDLRGSPVVGADGTVYFVFHNIRLTALDPADGDTLWTRPLGVNDHCFASPALGADGTIYVATQPGLLYAVSSAGQIAWVFDAASSGYPCVFRSSPAVAADGTIYLGTNQGDPASVLLAVNPNGTLKWAFEPADLPDGVPAEHLDIYSSPAIGADGTVHFGQEFGRVFAVSPDGAYLWHAVTNQGITWPSPVIRSDGRLLIADLSGTLYAFQADSQGLQAGSPWPRYRHGNGGSGAASGGR